MKESNSKSYAQSSGPENAANGSKLINRRKFVRNITSTALAFNVMPRHVLGGKNYIAPSDKITLAYIGTGTQGLRELLQLLPVPELQIIAVCDPNKEAIGYLDWGKDSLKNSIRKTINNPNWNPGGDNSIPGGRDNAKGIVDSYYAGIRQDQKYKACSAYADFRELLENEKDLNVVKIMTPDHLHGIIAMAAMKRGKHVTMHKPISNRLTEAMQVINMAGKSELTTHFIPWDSNGSMETVMIWINQGAIGTLKEIHNWSNRPVWPQYSEIPAEKPPVPRGFDWNLWLGPEADRPYHPNYTNMVFRGWYDFGGGSMADMGHYSLWTVFKALQLENPTIIEPNLSHYCSLRDRTAYTIQNDFSFPLASSVRFKYPATSSRPAVDLFWYDGGFKPPVPDELYEDDKELPAEGMMFVGEKGKILAGFRVENPRLIPEKRMKGIEVPETSKQEERANKPSGFQQFIDALKQGKQCPGSFREATGITEAVNLYAVALRTTRLLKYDAANRKITNVPGANKYLSREYRTGWDPASV